VAYVVVNKLSPTQGRVQVSDDRKTVIVAATVFHQSDNLPSQQQIPMKEALLGGNLRIEDP
jgi:hypothetical protein